MLWYVLDGDSIKVKAKNVYVELVNKMCMWSL